MNSKNYLYLTNDSIIHFMVDFMQLWFLTVRKNHQLCTRIGINKNHIAILFMLYQQSLPLNTVKEKLFLSRQSLFKFTRELEDKNFIEPQKNIGDKRRTDYILTDQGKELIHEMANNLKPFIAPALNEMGADAIQKWRMMMTMINQ